MEKICVIFAGGPETDPPCLPIPQNAFTLCADSGLQLAERLAITPHFVLGDFDSLGAPPENLPYRAAPPEKDDTDTLLCVRFALEKGYRRIFIYGAFGGRLDHVFANFQLLDFLASRKASGILVGARDYALLLPAGDAHTFPKREGYSLSLFAWSGHCRVKAEGVQYPLQNEVLTRAFPRGVSNVITGESARIHCTEGSLLAICSKI